jgi:phage terminase large subunit-like protein
VITLGWEVIDWIETYLHHGPGDVQGDPIVLDDEFAAFIVKAYEQRPALLCRSCAHRNDPRVAEEVPWRCRCGALLDVRRKVGTALLSRPKGRAKSELAGMVGCAEALGPVRFARWDGDRPVAAPVTYPFLRCLATEENQSGNTFGNIAFMLHPDTCSDELRDVYGQIDAGNDWQTSTRIYLPDGGEIRPSTASSAAKDGGKETFVVPDEIHLYTLPETRGMYATVMRNLTKRRAADPWAMATSTMHAPGAGSVSEDVHKQAAKDPTILLDHRQAPVGLDDIDGDRDQLIAALAEAYGDFAQHMDLEGLADKILSGQLEQPERYFLNRPVADGTKLMDARSWDGQRRELTLEPGDPVGVGWDGSEGSPDADYWPDNCGLVAVRLTDRAVFRLGWWGKTLPGPWEPPRDEIDERVAEVFATYRVARMYAEPRGWSSEIRQWGLRHRGPKDEDLVVEWPIQREREMAQRLDEFLVAVRTGQLIHDGDELVREHVLNAHPNVKRAPASDPEGRRERVLARKEHKRSRKKIDLFDAAVLADAAAQDAVAAGWTAEPKTSIYETRGLLTP